jgi:hypothetical protein
MHRRVTTPESRPSGQNGTRTDQREEQVKMSEAIKQVSDATFDKDVL